MDLTTLFFNVVPFLVVLTILVYIHELGHYVVARYNGVRVEVFSIGFGPELFGWTNKNGTRWKISAIPLGGYVKMLSENEVFATAQEQAKNKDSKTDLSPDSLLAKTVWQRMAISFAGPAANYLLAAVVLTGLYVIVGQKIPTGAVSVGKVVPGSAAEKFGVTSQDTIVAFNGEPLKSVEDLQEKITQNPKVTVQLTIMNQGSTQPKTLSVTLDETTVRGKALGRLGVELSAVTRVENVGPLQAVKASLSDIWRITSSTIKALGQMIMGQRSADGLTGPIGIANLAGKIAQQGFSELILLAAFLSINLGLINLFPIPVLDGGHILLYLIEAIRGKPVTEKIQEIAFRIGFAVVMGLILISFWNDLSRLQFFQSILSWVKH
jgi:regulator of sigma E protease